MTSPGISMVGDAKSTDCRAATASGVLGKVLSGKWREPVEAIRAAYATAVAEGRDPKKAVGELKRALPGVLWSGTFTQRKAEAIGQHSGLLVADLDDLAPDAMARARTALVADPHVFGLFTSPTGTGVKAVFRVPADVACHGDSFRAVAQQVRRLCGVEIDASGKDLARLCFVSFDPQGHLNEKAAELAPLPAGPMRRAETAIAVDLSERRRRAEALLGEIEWVDDAIGFAVCPGVKEHTNPDGPRDCRVNLDSAPTIFCVHNSCRRAIEVANRELRSRIGKAESSTAGVKRIDEADVLPPPIARPWPAPIHEAAFHGLAGEFVRAVEPHTEADLHAVLLLLLSGFGSMAGPSAYFMAQGARHPGRIWPVLVGDTAGGRKGSAWATTREVLRRVDSGWVDHCLASGLSSGEGLIWCVRDPIQREKRDKSGGVETVVEDVGVADKRLMAVEEEFGAVLKVAAREGNTLSDLLRKAWDNGNLRSLTKNSPARATGAHITVTAHITRADLTKYLADTDALNGFGNRFLWLAVRRSKRLPFGGELHQADLTPLVHRLQDALDHARRIGGIGFAPEARSLWVEAYNTLAIKRPGLLGALTQRAEAQVVRLAVLYALLDRAGAIGVPHLRAALAVWDYCQRSAAYIFGEAVGDTTADRILDELRAAGPGGLSGTDIRDLFHRNATRQRLADALDLLVRQGRVSHAKGAVGEGGGRPASRWKATNDQNDPTNGLEGLLAAKGTTETTKPPGGCVGSLSSSVLPVGPEAALAVEEGVL